MKWLPLIASVLGGIVFYFISEKNKSMNSYQLSKDFKLYEFLRTSTGLVNEPSPTEIRKLKLLAERVLQPFRDKVGRLKVTSGFRSAAVNEAVGGVEDSEHKDGLAADVVPLDMEINEAFKILQGLNLPIKKAILEDKNGTQWIHISIDLSGNPKQEFLTARFNNTAGKMQYFYV